MQLRWIYIKHFRNYTEAYLECSPGINLFLGDNAQGKTNLLEAIYFLVTGRSFRTTKVAELVQEGKNFFHIEASFIKHGIEQSLRISSNGKQRKILYNDALCSSLSHLLGILQGVILVPEDHDIIKGPPLARRRFLDLHIVQTDPLYVHHLTRYNKAMKQRNALLRSGSTTSIESWELMMAHSAAYITTARCTAVERLNTATSTIHNTLSRHTEELSLLYITNAPITDTADYYLNKYLQHRQRELSLGYTFSGPHKDDLSLTINNKDARAFASEGQQRSSITALRFAEWHTLASLSNISPLLAIDDIGISLDTHRQDSLTSFLPQFGQTFITSTQPLPSPTNTHATLIQNGTLSPSNSTCQGPII